MSVMLMSGGIISRNIRKPQRPIFDLDEMARIWDRVLVRDCDGWQDCCSIQLDGLSSVMKEDEVVCNIIASKVVFM